MGEEYGFLVRLWGVGHSQLPPSNAKGEDLKALLGTIINEALPFINSVPDYQSSDNSTPWKRGPLKEVPHSTAPVQLYERIVSADSLRATVEKHKPPGVNVVYIRPESWALRRSVHENLAVKGSASWCEFVRCFKDKHAEAELAFTPNIVDTKRHCEWNCAGVEIEAGGAKWVNWTLRSEESIHRLPRLLDKRVFPVLQATAAVDGRHEFVVVQIATRPGDDDKNDAGGIVRASYTSVELVRETADRTKVEWIMGTASNAGGFLPLWMQRLAIPGQIAKDVDMFLHWIAGEREKKDSEMLGGLPEDVDADGMTTVEL